MCPDPFLYRVDDLAWPQHVKSELERRDWLVGELTSDDDAVEPHRLDEVGDLANAVEDYASYAVERVLTGADHRNYDDLIKTSLKVNETPKRIYRHSNIAPGKGPKHNCRTRAPDD
jgi:hypothetical protein